MFTRERVEGRGLIRAHALEGMGRNKVQVKSRCVIEEVAIATDRKAT